MVRARFGFAGLIVVAAAALAQYGPTADAKVKAPRPEEPIRLAELAALNAWPASPDSVDALLSRTFGTRIHDDETGFYRYYDSVGTVLYEVIPGFVADTLHGLYIRFATCDKYTGQVREVYERLRKAFENAIGKPALKADTKRMEYETGQVIHLTDWNGDYGEWIMGMYHNPCYMPEFAVVAMSPYLRDLIRPQVEAVQNGRFKRLMATLTAATALYPAAYVSDADKAAIVTESGDTLFSRAGIMPELNSLHSALAGGATEGDTIHTNLNADGQAGIFDTTATSLEPPVEVEHGRPDFPLPLHAATDSCRVWVKALVGVDGHVVDARILRPSDHCLGCEDKALEAAYRNRYEPAKRDGQPVPVWVSYAVNFIVR